MVAVGGRSRVAGAWLRCVCVCVCLCALILSVCLLCGTVSCRVSRVVARYFLLVVRHLSLVVDCLSLCCALLLRVAACDCVVCVVVCVGEGGEGVYASNASSCVRSKRLLVYRHHANMFFFNGLGAGTHGDVLNVHTRVFQRVTAHTAPHHTTPHHDHNHSHTHKTNNQPTCGSMCANTEKLIRSRHSEN